MQLRSLKVGVFLVLVLALSLPALGQESSSRENGAVVTAKAATPTAINEPTVSQGGPESRANFLITCEVGTLSGFGYKAPWTSCGPGTEIFLKNLEVRAGVAFSPTSKYVTAGSSTTAGAEGLYWLGRFGAGGGVRYSRFSGTDFTKSGLRPSATFGVRRLTFYGNPIRLYFSYLLRDGGSDRQQIQPSHLQGLETRLEAQMYKHVRMGLAFYGPMTGLAQGNPQRLDIPRDRSWTGGAVVQFKFEFPGRDPSRAW